jgi:hypothetical protein
VTLLIAAAIIAPATVTAQAGATAAHPLVGAWVIDPGPPVDSAPEQLLLVGPGGILSFHSDHGTAYGAWTPTGADTADYTFYNWEGNAETGFMGFVIVRVSVEVASDGQTLSGTYSVEFPPALLEAFGQAEGEYGPSEMTGRRIIVEPMGAPVGPLPAGPPPASPDASPAG